MHRLIFARFVFNIGSPHKIKQSGAMEWLIFKRDIVYLIREGVRTWLRVGTLLLRSLTIHL